MLQAKTVFSYFHFLYSILLFLLATTRYKIKKEEEKCKKRSPPVQMFSLDGAGHRYALHQL